MKTRIAIIGLGYVGLPLAVEFAKVHNVTGFDISTDRVSELNNNIDKTNEINLIEVNKENLLITSKPEKISECDYVIVTVPTPITKEKLPDLVPLKKASQLIGANIKKGAIVIYESTVYPGVTEEECIPVLEASSGLISGEDFFVGYSPERINPGDSSNRISSIVKIVSGQNEEVLDKIAALYESIITAGVFKASSIKVAEAAKVIENTQRDLNISLMNELAVIFDKLNIDTTEVLEAAGTKWNFLKFKPGLVGGHCIAVDPYYLTYKAESVGYIPEVILAGRRVNDNMGHFIATTILKQLIKRKLPIIDARVTILGITFKENVPDIRNSKVFDLIKELNDFNFDIQVADPHADKNEVFKESGIKLTDTQDLKDSEVIVLAVAHDEYMTGGWDLIKSVSKKNNCIVIDLKSILSKETIPEQHVLWRL